MLVSHRCRFILFPDPMGACPWISHALEPWLDQPIVGTRNALTKSYFFRDMSPAEAELAFDMAGFAFRNYTRIAIVQNPAEKMVALYERIAKSDKMWRMRRSMGLGDPSFARWLAHTRPNGQGAAPLGGPRWRRFGAWSGRDWCADYVSYVVRAENARTELAGVFRDIGLSPAFGAQARDALERPQEKPSYVTPEARKILQERYSWDFALYGQNTETYQRAA